MSRKPRRSPGRPRPVLSDAAHAAIALELVRLCLGGRPARPELVAPLVDRSERRR